MDQSNAGAVAEQKYRKTLWGTNKSPRLFRAFTIEERTSNWYTVKTALTMYQAFQVKAG